VKLLFLTFSLIYSSGLWAQTFRGQIIDSINHKPIEAVSISILDVDNMSMCFTICENDGYFQLTCDDIKDAKYIHFSCLGFESKTFDIHSFKDGNKIFLTQAEINLKEVIVKYQPIKQTGDTLNYDAKGFILAQDRTIKDIIKRLPGIEVEENGKIKYQGKEINKFYIENLDLTDGKYNLITNNLAAKAVRTVQIFEKHQPISALRETNFSDQAALNLMLEDEAKGRLFGAVDLGLGIENSFNDPIWENRIIGMIFNNKLQEISVYKNANNGIDIKEDLIDFGTGQTFREFNTDQKERSVFSPITVSDNSGFKKKRSFFNNTHYFSTNTLTKIAKDKYLRIQAGYLHEKDKQSAENTTLYLLPDATLYLSENIRIKNLTNQIEGKFSYDSNSEKAYIKNTLNINTVFASSNADIEAQEKVQQKTYLDKLVLSDEFSLVKKFDSNKVFKFNSINEFNRLPQKITIFPGLYKELTGDSVKNEYLVQNATLESFKSHSFTSFSHSFSSFGVEYNLGIKFKTQLLRSFPDNKTSSLLNAYTDSLSNHYRFTETDAYLSPSLRFQQEYFKLSLVFNSTLRHLHKNDLLKIDSQQNKTIFLIQPSLNLYYDINAFWNLGFNSKYGKDYADIHSLYSGYILKSYRGALRYDDALAYRTAFNNTLFINYKHPIKGLFVNISGSYAIQERNNLTKTNFDGLFQQSSSVNQDVTDNGLTAFLSISKTLPFMSSVIDFKYLFVISDYSQIILDKLTKNSTEIHNFNLLFTVAPLKELNIEGGGTFTFRRLKKVSPEREKYTPIRDYKFEFAVNFIPNKKINLSWGNDLYYNNTSSSTFSYFSDLSLSYIMKNSEIQLFANNIFNETKFNKWGLGSFSESHYLTFLHERQILVKYKFNF
jgi:hypothetical protein